MTTVEYYDIKRFPINNDETAYFRLEVIDKTIVYVYVNIHNGEGSGFYEKESWTLLKMSKINSGYYVVHYENNTIPVHRLYGYYLYYHDKSKDEKDQKYNLPFEKYQIDHINRKRDDLNIDNMRLVTISENLKNRDPQRHEYIILDTKEELGEGEFIPIVFRYNDFDGNLQHKIIYKHGNTFYNRLRSTKRIENIYINPYKELPYRHDRDTTPGKRTYLIRWNGKTHEYAEEILNSFAESVLREERNKEYYEEEEIDE